MRGAVTQARRGALMEERFDQQIDAEAARKARKSKPNSILQIGGVLSSQNARSMTKDRLKIEERREEDRKVAWETQYTKALKKVYKATKSHRSKHQIKVTNMRKRWKVVHKELIDKSVYIID